MFYVLDARRESTELTLSRETFDVLRTEQKPIENTIEKSPGTPVLLLLPLPLLYLPCAKYLGTEHGVRSMEYGSTWYGEGYNIYGVFSVGRGKTGGT